MVDLFAFRFVAVVAILSAALILADTLLRAFRVWQRRRRNQGGAFAVVVDVRGRVVGAYLDPFAHPSRAARLHGPDSPWAALEQDDAGGWAWEGFGATEADARHAAQRLRRLHLALLPELRDFGEDGDVGEDGQEWTSSSFRVPGPPSF